LVPGDAGAWPLPRSEALFTEAQRYVGGEPITLFDDPAPGARHPGPAPRTSATGYVLLAAGVLGLMFAVTGIIPATDLSRPRELPLAVFWIGLSFGSFVAGIWLLRRGPPQI
jgi:hypothetical protein